MRSLESFDGIIDVGCAVQLSLVLFYFILLALDRESTRSMAGNRFHRPRVHTNSNSYLYSNAKRPTRQSTRLELNS